MTTHRPADSAMTDEEIERLAYSMANAKLGEGPAARCEGPTGYEIAQARFWAHRARHYFDTHLAAEIAARKEAVARAVAAETRIAELVAAPTHQAIIHAVASLAAAISLLERTPKTRWAAPSNKMFVQMLEDYRNALANARTALGDSNDR